MGQSHRGDTQLSGHSLVSPMLLKEKWQQFFHRPAALVFDPSHQCRFLEWRFRQGLPPVLRSFLAISIANVTETVNNQV